MRTDDEAKSSLFAILRTRLTRRFRKIAKSDDLASSSVRMEQLGTHWTDFHEI